MIERICPATEAVSEGILKLYKIQFWYEFCCWTDDYPDTDTITDDISDKRLFILRESDEHLIASQNQDINQSHR